MFATRLRLVPTLCVGTLVRRSASLHSFVRPNRSPNGSQFNGGKTVEPAPRTCGRLELCSAAPIADQRQRRLSDYYDAERRDGRSHAERGNEIGEKCLPQKYGSLRLDCWSSAFRRLVGCTRPRRRETLAG